MYGIQIPVFIIKVPLEHKHANLFVLSMDVLHCNAKVK